MGCPPVRGDNPRALASGKRVDYLTYRLANMVYLFYTTYISVDLAHREIFRAKVGKGGIEMIQRWEFEQIYHTFKERVCFHHK